MTENPAPRPVPGAGGGRSPRYTPEPEPIPPSGNRWMDAAAVTCGRARIFASICSTTAARAFRSEPYFAGTSRHSHSKQVLGTKPGIDSVDFKEAARHQAGAAHEHQREGHLGDHERAPKHAVAARDRAP